MNAGRVLSISLIGDAAAPQRHLAWPFVIADTKFDWNLLIDH